MSPPRGDAVSETILKILLSELASVRLTCQRCKAVAEVPIDVLGDRKQGITCPGCGAVASVGGRHQPDALDALAEAAKGLKQFRGFDVAFVVPVPAPAK